MFFAGAFSLDLSDSRDSAAEPVLAFCVAAFTPVCCNAAITSAREIVTACPMSNRGEPALLVSSTSACSVCVVLA